MTSNHSLNKLKKPQLDQDTIQSALQKAPKKHDKASNFLSQPLKNSNDYVIWGLKKCGTILIKNSLTGVQNYHQELGVKICALAMPFIRRIFTPAVWSGHQSRASKFSEKVPGIQRG